MSHDEPQDTTTDFFELASGIRTWLLQLSGNLGAVFLPKGILDLFGLSADPDAPPANRLRFYSKGSLPFWRNSTVRSIGSAVPTVGTMLAADGSAVIEVAPGTPGQVLTFDPEQANSVKWHPPGQPPDITGQHQASSPFIYQDGASPIASQVQYTRVFIPQGVTLSSMKIFHILGGGASRLINLGIYDQADPADEAGAPQNKLAETGALATNVATNSFIEAAFSTGDLDIAATGFCWLAFIADTGNPLQFSATPGSYPPNFIPLFVETSSGTTLPATASSLSNPGGALIFNAALEA